MQQALKAYLHIQPIAQSHSIYKSVADVLDELVYHRPA